MSIDRGYGIATSAVIADSYDLDALIADTEAAKVAAEAAQAAAETAQSAAETAETNAETAETNAETAETNAAASATAAASSASAAQTAQTAAETAETNAETAQTAAEAAQVAAETAETNAETAETNAETAQAAAEAAQASAESVYDNFDDRYLGDKTSAPTLDNDGDALVTGAMYFDTTAQTLKVYDGSTWLNTTPSASDQADITAVAADATDIGTVASNIADVNTVAGNNTNITTVATNDSNITTVAGVSSNVTTVAGISSNVTTVAGISSNVTTVAGISSDVSAVSSNISAITNASNNIDSINNFGDTYFVSATEPASPTEGDLWFDTSTDTMKVYNGSAWQNAGSSVNGVENSVEHTATSGQTSFAATYDAGFVQVYLNGVRLDAADYTATDGANIVLDTGATAGDTVYIQSFGTFELANIEINDMTDVNTTGVTDGQALLYNSTSGDFEAGDVDALPDQTSNSGKYLTTDGSTASWAVLQANNTDEVLYEHANSISTAYTIDTGNNAMSVGPITISTGGSVTIPTGSTYTIV
jgi:hypothetical protein